MFIHNINPTIFTLGPFEIRYYGVVYVFGFLVLYYLLRKNKEKLKLTEDAVDNLLMYVFLGGIVGARLFHFLVSEPKMFFQNPLEFFMLWHGGMSFFGGLIGGSLGIYLFSRKNKFDFYTLADFIVPIFAVFMALGRIANFVNAELVGTVTNVPWCVVFPGYAGCRHPYQLYAALSHLLLLGILLLTRKLTSMKGWIFWVFTTGYCGMRFLTDFFRDDIRYFGLSVWQYVCIVGFIAGIIMINKINNKSR
jgi:phosphatidylglycerol:prolipoprotein diacylglycerol transferase